MFGHFEFRFSGNKLVVLWIKKKYYEKKIKKSIKWLIHSILTEIQVQVQIQDFEFILILVFLFGTFPIMVWNIMTLWWNA